MIDNTDKKILQELQSDARITNVALSEAVNLSPAPCLRRVKELEKEGVIKNYTALLCPVKVGWSVSVFIQVRLEKQAAEGMTTFEDTINSYPEVMECYLMTGVSDYLLRVVARDLNCLQKFVTEKLAKIPGVANIESNIALKQVKYKTQLPV
jgi:DNA-binding Lrp family transcriptional regulator